MELIIIITEALSQLRWDQLHKLVDLFIKCFGVHKKLNKQDAPYYNGLIGISLPPISICISYKSHWLDKIDITVKHPTSIPDASNKIKRLKQSRTICLEH